MNIQAKDYLLGAAIGITVSLLCKQWLTYWWLVPWFLIVGAGILLGRWKDEK
jgi:hypothetical protein